MPALMHQLGYLIHFSTKEALVIVIVIVIAIIIIIVKIIALLAYCVLSVGAVCARSS
jgi:hypothetical protein